MGARARSGVLAALLLSGAVVFPGFGTIDGGGQLRFPGFGTIDGGGQHREHERITRAALACTADDSPGDCLRPRSIDQLAGHGNGFGAVGAPDRTEVAVPAAHCDDADYLTGDYPQTRDDATVHLTDCVEHLRGRFREAVERADELVDGHGRIVAAEVNLDGDCAFDTTREERAMCTTLESLGRALHGVQDFYSHSSWADEPDPTRPIGPANPRGRVLNNFQKAVTAAVIETRHQWAAFGDQLRREYGPRRAATMTCALTRDDPADDCARSGRTIAAPVLFVLLILASTALRGRRRRRP
ncbi:hypothetical protein Q0Z83_001430 [Actinoplanes sichuanensis]|uniref:Secreted protein n=1 Tax=Actinoplanes sichuanensis TaxID=512349 RepID=A0ABW4AS14_9ACTN|nr:hypothetical protein [Actinoplanes sichuanensis]BEL01952.1 hypothetical protein Q0Z83_001430 [Actinoplanes sichuanensis]